MVPDADWQTVPPARRAAVDRQHEVDLAAARTELAAATASLAELKRTPAPAAAARPGTSSIATAAPDDEWVAAMRDHEHSRGDAFTRVEAAKAEWRRTDLNWRELRLETARARLELVVCERELVRAQTIDRGLPGTDHYDVAPLRGQFSRAQQRWHAVASNARQARIAFERASTTLASAKEAYAQLMRNGPAQLPLPPPAETDERTIRLDLSGWAITRSDISRRRGLRHYLEAAANAPPQLRKSAFKLSPTPRSAPLSAGAAPPVPRDGVQVPARAAGAEPAPPRKPAPTADRTMPWDVVEPAGKTATAKPAPPPPRATPPAPATTSVLEQPARPPAAPRTKPTAAAPTAAAEAPITAAKPVAQPRAKPMTATANTPRATPPASLATTEKAVPAPIRTRKPAPTAVKPTGSADLPAAPPAKLAPPRTRAPSPATSTSTTANTPTGSSAPPRARTMGPELPPGGLPSVPKAAPPARTQTPAPGPRIMGPELPPGGLAKKPAGRAKPATPVDPRASGADPPPR